MSGQQDNRKINEKIGIEVAEPQPGIPHSGIGGRNEKS